MKEITFEICFISELGFDWLNETITINSENYKEIITDYFQRNKEKAIALNNRWEEDRLICLFDNIHTLGLYSEPLIIELKRFIDEDKFYL